MLPKLICYECEECNDQLFVDEGLDPEWCPFCKSHDSLMKYGEVIVGE